MASGVICLVTIHGIGFQQPPVGETPGYADMLHEHLSEHLDASLLSDDPHRSRSRRARTDHPAPAPHPLPGVFPRRVSQSAAMPSGLLATLRALENDVAAYVCRNDLRERVRTFVRDALHRLCYRDDVEAVVVNAHSNGTAIAFDVMRQLTPIAAGRVRWLVTAGSPLRKYTDLFYWGTEVGSIADMGSPKGWTNFWDERDPVADPLAPPVEWLRGTDLPPADPRLSLYQQVSDAGAVTPVPIEDRLVDNLSHGAGGGLQAHNYWDNDQEVVQPLAGILREIAAG